MVRRARTKMEKTQDAGQRTRLQEVVCFQSVPYSPRGLEMLQVVLRGLPQFPAPVRLAEPPLCHKWVRSGRGKHCVMHANWREGDSAKYETHAGTHAGQGRHSGGANLRWVLKMAARPPPCNGPVWCLNATL